jgi:BNR/Asp-box repeat
LPELSVNSLAISPVNPNAIFAGTGSTSSYDRINNNSGIGVARSLDAGLSWKVFARSTFTGRAINSIVPTALDSGNIILAATWQDQGGVWRSIDNGESFHRISGNTTARLPDAGVTSLIGDPLKPKVFYAAVPQASQGSPPGGIYRSDDGGLTWKNISDGITALSDSRRILLAIHSSALNNIVYADIINWRGGLSGVFRLNNSDALWTRLPSPPRLYRSGKVGE